MKVRGSKWMGRGPWAGEGSRTRGAPTLLLTFALGPLAQHGERPPCRWEVPMAAGLGSRGWAPAGRQLGSGTQASLGGNSVDGGEVLWAGCGFCSPVLPARGWCSYLGPGHCFLPRTPFLSVNSGGPPADLSCCGHEGGHQRGRRGGIRPGVHVQLGPQSAGQDLCADVTLACPCVEPFIR